MKGMEQMLASMIGLDANKMQAMMAGFIDNAAHLAKGVDEIKAGIDNINRRLDILERHFADRENIPCNDEVLQLEKDGYYVKDDN